jgi:hypothetical protein
MDTTIDWGELDKLNSEYYARRPAWIVKAEQASEVAWSEHNSAVEEYVSYAHSVDHEAVRNAWRKVERAERIGIALDEYAAACRAAWQAGKDDPEHELVWYLEKYGLGDLIEQRAQDIGLSAQTVKEYPGLLPDGFPY